VLEVPLAVGCESAQALAKAVRREVDATPTEVRGGESRVWARLLEIPSSNLCTTLTGGSMIQPTRIATLPEGHVALTATAHGMVDRTLTRAASAAFGELYPAIAGAQALGRARTWLAFSPDDPQGPDDPACRYVAGVLFDEALEATPGTATRPDIALRGSLEWWPIASGPAAVFLHRGPYDSLFRAWQAIYRDWLPASGCEPRDAPPFEVMMNDPQTTPAAELLTEIWIPLIEP
jgi:AraC family transcriptional regulator